jgi:glycosyltransferase involved in cell wall biosynthesis
VPFVTTVHEHPLVALKEYAKLFPFESTIGDFGIYAASYPLDTFSLRACLKVSDHVVVPGKFTKDYLLKVDRKISSEKISVIYNGINLEEIDSVEADNEIEEQTRIISYGRLVSTKGFSYLLEIMPDLHREFAELSLTILGKGPLANKLSSQASRLSIENMLHLDGFLPHRQLIKKIKDSDLVVLPTFHEVGPFISALEAMGCGKTVVVFDLCFSREFVENMENGIMVKPQDAKDLCDKVKMVLHDVDLRKEIGRKARDYVETHHNWSLLVDKYVEMYEETLHR